MGQGKLPASRISNRMAIIRRVDIENLLKGNPYRRVIPCQLPKVPKTSVSKLQTKGKERIDEPMDFYSGEEVMNIYKVKQSWLYSCAKRNSIPTCRISGRTYYSKRHIDEHFGTAIDYNAIEAWLTTSEVEEQ